MTPAETPAKTDPNSDPATKGGSSSGNWAHRGRPGRRGGSSPGTGGLAVIGVQPGTPRENIAEAASKARERRAENDRLKQLEAEMFEELGGRSEAVPGLRPGGRAPRGQGSEYAARNWVADRIEYFEDQLAAINERASRSRGTRRDRAAQSVNSGRKAAITESLGMATSLAAGFLEGGGSFASEKSFFQEIFALPMALTGG